MADIKERLKSGPELSIEAVSSLEQFWKLLRGKKNISVPERQINEHARSKHYWCRTQNLNANNTEHGCWLGILAQQVYFRLCWQGAKMDRCRFACTMKWRTELIGRPQKRELESVCLLGKAILATLTWSLHALFLEIQSGGHQERRDSNNL